jgi:hypothetical protein
MNPDEITITSENLEDIREQVSTCDQARALIVGCRTWGIFYEPGRQRGQMTVWPNGRGAIDFGGDSIWGDWDETHQLLVTDDVCRSRRTASECLRIEKPLAPRASTRAARRPLAIAKRAKK